MNSKTIKNNSVVFAFLIIMMPQSTIIAHMHASKSSRGAQVKHWIKHHKSAILKGFVALGAIPCLYYGLKRFSLLFGLQGDVKPQPEPGLSQQPKPNQHPIPDQRILRFNEPMNSLEWRGGVLTIGNALTGTVQFWNTEGNVGTQEPDLYVVRYGWPPEPREMREDNNVYRIRLHELDNQLVWLRRTQDGRAIAQWSLIHNAPVTAYDFRPLQPIMQPLIATCCDNGELSLWSIGDDVFHQVVYPRQVRLVYRRQFFDAHQALHWQAMRFNEDGSLLSISSTTGTVYILNVAAMLADQQHHIAGERRNDVWQISNHDLNFRLQQEQAEQFDF